MRDQAGRGQPVAETGPGEGVQVRHGLYGIGSGHRIREGTELADCIRAEARTGRVLLETS